MKILILTLLFAMSPLSAPAGEIVVSAAASLKPVLEELSLEYRGGMVVFNFGASGSLLRQIQSGAPVDIFVPAASKQMDELASKDLLEPGSRVDLVSNDLVLVAPENSGLRGFEDLTLPEVKRIAIGEPKSVPAGAYAAEVLEFLKLREPLANKLVYAKDVRQVLVYVESRNVEAGIVYASDATDNPRIRLAAVAPSDSHAPIIYPAAVLKNSRHKDEARKFLEFLQSETALAAFQRHGFRVPGHP